jgi:hypothetical protein
VQDSLLTCSHCFATPGRAIQEEYEAEPFTSNDVVEIAREGPVRRHKSPDHFFVLRIYLKFVEARLVPLYLLKVVDQNIPPFFIS